MPQKFHKIIFSAIFVFLFIQTLVASDKPYFQQEVNYKIDVTLNDKTNMLYAWEEIIYTNNSPDTLKELWFHIYPNAYKNDSTALCRQMLEEGNTKLFFAKEQSRGSIDSLDFSSVGKQLHWEFHPLYIDICKIILNSPLAPGGNITITTPFTVKIPSAEFSRLGHLGQAYSISQWYPKPAVYDRSGWHQMPYLNQGEFFSEFGSFEVSITLPKNYIIAATGDLQNPDEIDRMNELAKETVSNAGFSDDLTFPPSERETKTLIYKQNNIHDFAWFADKRFHVLRSEITLPETKNKVTTWAMFTNNQSHLWIKGIDYLNDALSYYSKWIGDYPYKQCTIVDGTIAAGTGMEYPNMSIIGVSGDAINFETTIVHEVGHNWFYGMLGSNERDHAWMDEGINSFYEMRYAIAKYPPAQYKGWNELSESGKFGDILGTSRINYREAADLQYKISASSYKDQPIELPSTDFSISNYSSIVYKKTGNIFAQLKAFLGDSIFDATMQEYFNKWHYKHPSPEDLEAIFKNNTDKDLSWFFHDLLQTIGKPDYAILSVKKESDGYDVKISDKGDFPMPVNVSAMKNDKTENSKWIFTHAKDTLLHIECEDCDVIKIDPNTITADFDRRNNSIRTKGILKRIEPLQISIPGHLEYPYRTYINTIPVVAFNEYNGLMAGAVFHNMYLPFRKFEYIFTPLYAFDSHTLAGAAEINYHFYLKKSIFNSVIPSVRYRQFDYANESYRNPQLESTPVKLKYWRIEPLLTFNIRPKNFRTAILHSITLSAVLLNRQDIDYNLETTTPVATVNYHHNEFYRIRYNLENKRQPDPWKLELQLENNKDFTKISTTINYKVNYFNSRKGVSFRLFAGYMINENDHGDYGFSLSENAGFHDYAFDQWYFGRTETDGIFSRQIAEREGNFKIYNALGANKKWIAALNINAGLPIRIPLQIFADIGTSEGYKKDIPEAYDAKTTFSSDLGFCLAIIPKTFEIYFPLIETKEIKAIHDFQSLKFTDEIRFILNIADLNPFRLRTNYF